MTVHNKKIIFLLLSIIVFYSKISYSQVSCDTLLNPSNDPNYSYKLIGNRCEGFYIEKNTIPTLDLISFTYGKLSFNLKKKGVLKIQKTDFIKSNIYVRAVTMPLRTYYRMDSQLIDDGFMEWPMDYCLYPKRLHVKRIGVYGWLSEKFYPVIVNPNKVSLSYYLKFRSITDLEDFKIQILSMNGIEINQPEKRVNLHQPYIRAGSQIEFALDKYVDNIGDMNEAVVLFKSKQRNGRWIKPLKVTLVIREQ